MVVTSARNVNGNVECPNCGETCGDANLEILSGPHNAVVRGGVGSTWIYVGVRHTDCGHEFEIGGQAATTSESK